MPTLAQLRRRAASSQPTPGPPIRAARQTRRQSDLAARNILANKRSRRDASRAEATPPTASGKRQRRVVARPLGSGRWLVALALAAIFIASRDPKAAPGPRRSPQATARTARTKKAAASGTTGARKAARPTPPGQSTVKATTPPWRACRTSTRPSPRCRPCRRAPSPSRGCSTTRCRGSRRASPSREDGATGAPCGAAVPLTSTATPRTTPGESSREERKGRKGRLWILPK